MGSWKDLFIDMLKLTDEVKRLNRSVERLDSYSVEMDKRIVRLETMVEIAKTQQNPTEQKSIETR
jgi:phage shock protein A